MQLSATAHFRYSQMTQGEGPHLAAFPLAARDANPWPTFRNL